MSPATLLTKLNELGGANGIGRLDLVENRYVGMKSRGVYETPGGTVLIAAHRGIESITLDRGAAHLKDELMPRYAELIYNGFWWAPEREMLQALIDKSQEMVTGTVRLKLYKGSATVVGRSSPYSLYSEAHVTFEDDAGAYDQKDAAGFIKLNALRLRLLADPRQEGWKLMRIDAIPIGKNPPDDINVIVEVPHGGHPVKYEMDKESGTLFVDRFMHTAMQYPCNYGFVPHTLSDDGDPVDVLVVSRIPVVPGAVIRSRPIGVLMMHDEAGQDEKILAVPVEKLNPYYKNVQNYTDMPDILIQRITHFFEHYKDLEEGKWVKVDGWKDASVARELIMKAIEAGKKS